MTPFQQLCLVELDRVDTGPMVFETLDDYEKWRAGRDAS